MSFNGTGAYVPIGHTTHVSSLYVYSPGSQLEHFDRVASLSSPKAQDSQSPSWEWRLASVPSSSMYLPVGQSSHAAAPAPLYLPSGHTVHVSIDLSPFSLEYFPAVQFTQIEFWELSNQVPFGHRRVGAGVGTAAGVELEVEASVDRSVSRSFARLKTVARPRPLVTAGRVTFPRFAAHFRPPLAHSSLPSRKDTTFRFVNNTWYRANRASAERSMERDCCCRDCCCCLAPPFLFSSPLSLLPSKPFSSLSPLFLPILKVAIARGPLSATANCTRKPRQSMAVKKILQKKKKKKPALSSSPSDLAGKF